MGTHPIFESDFDCLTEWERTIEGGMGSRVFWDLLEWDFSRPLLDSIL